MYWVNDTYYYNAYNKWPNTMISLLMIGHTYVGDQMLLGRIYLAFCVDLAGSSTFIFDMYFCNSIAKKAKDNTYLFPVCIHYIACMADWCLVCTYMWIGVEHYFFCSYTTINDINIRRLYIFLDWGLGHALAVGYTMFLMQWGYTMFLMQWGYTMFLMQ